MLALLARRPLSANVRRHDYRMKTFSPEERIDALVRRRIKFVVEKAAMARFFRRGTSAALQEELFKALKPSRLAHIQTLDEYDRWLVGLIESERWEPYSRNGLRADRWAYFAKLINIVTYEIVANRELFSQHDWERIRPFLHLPIDANVSFHLEKLDPTFPAIFYLKGMTETAYWTFQTAARELAAKLGISPIWFEAAWSA